MEGLKLPPCIYLLTAAWKFIPYLMLIALPTTKGTRSETTWQNPLQVSEYQSYSSGRLQQYSIPQNCIRSAWVFTAYRTPYSCQDKTIVIFMQHGSFPVINPLNETFPEGFYLGRTDLVRIDIKADNDSILYTLPSPLPGNIYSMSYLGDEMDDKITPGGLGSTCKYEIEVTHIVEAYDTVPDILMNTFIPLSNITTGNNLYRFLTTEHTWQMTVLISNCIFTPENATYMSSTQCPMNVITSSLSVPYPSNNGSYTVSCSSGHCSLLIPSPTTQSWQYIMFMVNEPGSISLSMYIESEECIRSEYWKEEIRIDQITSILNRGVGSHGDNISVTSTAAPDEGMTTLLPESLSTPSYTLPINTTETPPSFETNNVNGSCLRYEQLGRFATAGRPFKVGFYMRLGIATIPNRVFVSDNTAAVVKFNIEPVIDSGGTLKIAAGVENKPEFQNGTDHFMKVQLCIQRLSIPVTSAGVSCKNHMLLEPQYGDPQHIYFPYPEPGAWFMAIKSRCYSNQTGNNGTLGQVPCPDIPTPVVFSVAINPCVEGGCGEYGTCREYYSGVLHFSSCRCFANYRGYGCSDDSLADSDAAQLTATLLLTLSNLAFLPAVIVALYRRFYVEALVYTYTMFFSTVYHACDGQRKYLHCIMPYNVLSHCDFFGAIMSFWITLVGMARLPREVRSFSYVLAALGLAIGVSWDKHNIWTFAVPCGCALITMLISWVVRCKQRHACHPSRFRWLLYLLPGVLIALVGLVIFAFFETTSNYQFTHSAWHACMALCLVFILPPAKSKHKGEGVLAIGDNQTTVSVQMLGVYRPEDQAVKSVVQRDESDTQPAISNGNACHCEASLSPIQL